MDPDGFSKIRFGNGLTLLIFQHRGCLYIIRRYFFHFLFLKMNLFWTIWKKSLVRSQPNHQASKKASKNVFFFEPYQEGRTLAKSVRRNLRDRCLKRAAFPLVSYQWYTCWYWWPWWIYHETCPGNQCWKQTHCLFDLGLVSSPFFLKPDVLVSWWLILLHSGKPMNCFVYTPRKDTKWTPIQESVGGKTSWLENISCFHENIWKSWVFSVCSGHISLSPDCQISKMFDCSLQPFKLITA